MRPVSPQNYDVTFEPDLKKFTFSGREKIAVKVNKPASVLTMNSLKLEIKSCSVGWKGEKMRCETSLDEKEELLKIRLPKKIVGDAEVFLEFAGELNDRLAGFYRSEYEDGGKKKVMATTQFEAADARRAFPCWDEPEAKATFDISILADRGLEAVSNMPVASKKKAGKKTLFKFARTPVMSTYLVYLGVGEFESVQDKLGKIKIRVLTTKGKKGSTGTALEMTKKFLGYYQTYFGIPYPLPKLDVIAVPDFASGAMENWGAITFRETALLYDPETSSTATLHRIAEVIAHELAHQWFGNLVTMRWWNDLWLNESFATFMATKAVDHFYPEWDFWDQFASTSVNSGMDLDALRSSHPIDVPVKKPSQLREIFDDISYDKGGSVLRMLQDYLGEEDFRAGLRSYLKEHKYGNATTDDLWEHLGRASKKPVGKVMDTWIRQVGYPVVEAKVDGTKVTLTQRRFLEAGGPSKGLWMIPLSVKMRERFVRKLMTKKSDGFSLDKPGDWFKVNFEENGFYRVKYDRRALEMLTDLVESGKLGHLDRWGLANDMFALTVAGEVGVRYYLSFLGAYDDEDDYLVVDEVASDLYYLYMLSFGEDSCKRIAEVGRRYFRKVFDRVGWEPVKGEKPTTKLLRPFVISALGRLGDEDVVAEAKERFARFLKDPQSLSPNIRSAVYSLAAWCGDARTQEQMKELYRKAETQEEKIRFLAAVASFQDEKLLRKALDYSLTDEVRMQDMAVLVVSVASNPYGKTLVWPWMKKNWKEIGEKFMGMGIPLLKRMIESLASVPDGKHAEDIRRFFQKHPTPGTEMALAQTFERMKIRERLLEKMRKEFAPEVRSPKS